QEPILDLEYQPGRLSGTTMNLNLVPVFDNNGEMVGTLASYADITARKAADDQLRLSEANFRNLVENSIQGVCVDLEDRFLFANQAMADIFSYESPLDILNLSTAEDLIAPDEVGRIKEYTRQRLARLAAPNRYRTQGVRRDGTPVWLEIMADVVIWDGADAVMATVVDITAEVHAEASREQLADALNHFPEPVVLFDKEDRLIFRNDAYLRDLQLVSDYDPMGQTFEAFMLNELAQRIRETLDS
ncbi:MAG: PAS domain S-box protein, partial [Alphaproteobacteria bacterium]